MSDLDTKKLLLLENTIKFFEDNGRFPTLEEVREVLNTPRRTLRRYFGSLEGLISAATERIDEPILTTDRAEATKRAIKGSKRFFITTAVVGAEVDQEALKSVKNYCKKNKALLLILPAADPAESVSKGLDESLLSEFIVFEESKLCSNLNISDIKLSAKQIMPHTGLGRFGQRNNSMIFASPKQNLEFVSVSNNKIPHALMTTGAITLPAYQTQRYMSLRTAYIAKNDHVMGGIVVDIDKQGNFHFRQVQFDENGSFIDLCIQYSSNGKTSKIIPEALIAGDWHVGSTCETVRKVTLDILKEVKPKYMVLHDLFNGTSINHHVEKRKITKSKTIKMTLKDELEDTKKELNVLKKLSKLIVVKSNHDEWIDRYLEECRFVDDSPNFRLSLELAIAKYDGFDPLETYINDSDIKFLKRDEDFIVSGIQLGSHGDIEGSLMRIEKSFSKAVTGHSHSGAILRGIYRVGTSTKLREPYAQGPISWTNTHCIVYPNGQRQLINIINSKWKA